MLEGSRRTDHIHVVRLQWNFHSLQYLPQNTLGKLPYSFKSDMVLSKWKVLIGIAICKRIYPFYYEVNRLSHSIILNFSNFTLLYRWQLKRKGENIKEEWTIPWVQYSKSPLKRECHLTIAAQSLVGRSVRTARAISWKCLDISFIIFCVRIPKNLEIHLHIFSY